MIARSEASLAASTRLPYWDNVKFVLIFLVVFAHFLLLKTDVPAIGLLMLCIYTFHMPAFAFVSGFWSKSKRSRRVESLIPFAVAYVVFNGLFMLWAAWSGDEVLLTYPYYSLWYLIALCVWRLSVARIASFRHALPLSVLAAIMVGFWPDAGNVFAFGRTVAFYPFFLAGYLLPRTWGDRLSGIRPLARVLMGAVLVMVSSVAIVLTCFLTHVTYSHVLMEPYVTISDAVTRACVLVVACLGTVTVLVVAPGKRWPACTTIGANSLVVYLLHRYFVLAAECASVVDTLGWVEFVACSAVGSMLLLVVLGSPPVGRLVRGVLDVGSALVTKSAPTNRRGILPKTVAVVLVAAISAAPVYAMHATADGGETDMIVPRMSAVEEEAFADSYTILFAGDLILLEDQVRRAYTGDGYDFSPMFEYTKPYIEAADVAIAVFEGPTAGAEAGYSSGNFDDAKAFWVNHPDEFAMAVKDAGFDLVTTANNHLLDRGEPGAMRTLDVLDAAGIEHVGSYRNDSEKKRDSIRVIEVEGLRLAVLAYTYGVNDDDGGVGDYLEDELVGGNLSHITSLIVDPSSPWFATCKSQVVADLARTRELACDLIVVLPHWGTQFSLEPDAAQQAWREVFLEGGVDIILGDHTHSVQPIVMESRDGRQTLTCYCPGNYANVYRGFDGDASALVEVRVSRDSKQVIGGAVIPLWCESAIDGNYRALPVYATTNDPTLSSALSTYDLDRIDEVQSLVTSTMLGADLSLDMSCERHYFDQGGSIRTGVRQIALTKAMRVGTLYRALADATDVCFVGDSVTEGTRNGGYGWYEPIEKCVSGRVFNVSRGGATVQTLLEMTDGMVDAAADLYVVAVGANDVRYRDASICAMSAADYVSRLRELVVAVRAHVPDAKFVFVAPWTSTDGDLNSALGIDEKRAMNTEYSDALAVFCKADGHAFINPNPAIDAVVGSYLQARYLVDFIHPNATWGIELYARAAMECP